MLKYNVTLYKYNLSQTSLENNDVGEATKANIYITNRFYNRDSHVQNLEVISSFPRMYKIWVRYHDIKKFYSKMYFSSQVINGKFLMNSIKILTSQDFYSKSAFCKDFFLFKFI